MLGNSIKNRCLCITHLFHKSHSESDFADIEGAVSTLKDLLNEQLSYDKSYVSNYEQTDTLSRSLYSELYTALNGLGNEKQKNAGKIETAANNEQRLQEMYQNEELLKANYWNGLIKFGFGSMTVFAAVGSLIATAGTDAPVAIAAITYVAEGSFLAYGVSEIYEGNEQAWYAA